MYGIERNFFLPFDTEIDSVTLASLIDRAQKYALPTLGNSIRSMCDLRFRFRGKTGVTRKVVVTDLSVQVAWCLCRVAPRVCCVALNAH